MLQSRWASSPKSIEPLQSQKLGHEENDIHQSSEIIRDDPSIDLFAQTASADHLFSDDITPVTEPVVEHSTADVISDNPSRQPQSQSQSTSHTAAPRELRNSVRGNRGRVRGRRRSRGRRGGHAADIQDKTEAQDACTNDAEVLPSPALVSTVTNSQSDPVAGAPAMDSIPTEPREKVTQSVRGDRTLTGGTARPRLTEEQLNAKLANMRSKNEALQFAHARAEADQAKFEAREAVLKKEDVERKKALAEKQKQERKNRAQMMGERERNRQRKLGAQGGRDWDLEKEEGFSGTGEVNRRMAIRGAHVGITPSRANDTRMPNEHVDETCTPQSYRGRGRNRGGRGNRGSRDGYPGSHYTESEQRGEQQPPSAADFPELPCSTTLTPSIDVAAPKSIEFPVKSKTTDAKTSESKGADMDRAELPSPLEKGRSWADEVA